MKICIIQSGDADFFVLDIPLNIGERCIAYREGRVMIQTYRLAYRHRFVIDHHALFECSHTHRTARRHDQLRLDWCHIALQIPRQLQRAVDGLTDGNHHIRIAKEPLEQGNIHLLDGTLYIQEITL